MLNTQDYFVGWVCYLVGALGLLVCWWRITRGLVLKELRDLLRMTAAVVLLTPYYVDAPNMLLAPALMVSLLEGVTRSPAAMVGPAVSLLATLLCVFILSLIMELAYRYYKKWQLQRNLQKSAGDEEDNAREALLAESFAASVDHSRSS